MKNLQIIRLVCVLCLTMCILSCATLKDKIDPDAAKKALLKSELERWSSFKLTGLGDAKYSAFTKRCNTIIQLADGKFRFDMIDSGILGLVGGGTFISAFTDGTNLQLKLPGTTNIVSMALGNQDVMKLLTTNVGTMLAGLEGTIISQLSCTVRGVTIRFTEKMQIREAVHNESNIKLNFTYDNANNLETITVASGVFSLTYDVQKMENTGISITPLR